MWLRYTASGALLLYAIAYYQLFTNTTVVANVIAIVACAVAFVCSLAYWARKLRRQESTEAANIAIWLVVGALVLHFASLIVSGSEDATFMFFAPTLLGVVIWLLYWINSRPKEMR